ncbi:hypothetical protein SCMU_14200 [Sinomonas cyclohexanicum]|uniref:Uncharacterized protein n=1 Tax=Sinomonas cyclohexanicum TaxID=322009 RepID=A0ABN6FIB2_SINCY|nr:hypothetical protein [Corynebacterium cyclohexanicum]BCT75578.1 hypothetical protein SCMU_14200 [Corynebacterium cyclohexanicum]
MNGPEHCNHQARPVEKNPATVWEVMLKHTVDAGPLTSVVHVTAERMAIDNTKPWMFGFWNDDDEGVVAAFPYDAVAGVRRV